jgi:hypothetical protein
MFDQSSKAECISLHTNGMHGGEPFIGEFGQVDAMPSESRRRLRNSVTTIPISNAGYIIIHTNGMHGSERFNGEFGWSKHTNE